MPAQECFDNSSLFHKALKEAFESFCNKTVASTSVAELMAAFCDNLLRKVRAGFLAYRNVAWGTLSRLRGESVDCSCC